MKLIRILCTVALASLAMGADCGEDDTSTSSGSGGGAAAGTCDAVCDAMFAQSCFYGGGEQDCRMSCNGWETQYVEPGPDYCHDAWDRWKACMSSETLTCIDDSNPDWNAAPCREPWDHVQNYCIYGNATPATACTTDAAFDAFCTSTPSTPTGTSCFGDVPAGCVVGGNENNSNLYCCP